MKRLITLCIVLTVVALIAAPAFAEVQNVKVSGDINSKWIVRSDYDFDSESTIKDNDDWFMTTTRVQIDADLTDNVATCVRIINERDWDTEQEVESYNSTEMALDLANVTLKECFYSPLTVTVGKQNLRFGNGLVVGDPDTNDTAVNNAIYADDLSVRKSFDAIRATLDYNPTVVDLIFAKIDANNIAVGTSTSTAHGPQDDIDLLGINVAYNFNNSYNAMIEGYLFERHDRHANPIDVCDVIGANGSMELFSGLTITGEIAHQFGDYNNTVPTPDKLIDRDALAVDAGVICDALKDQVSFLPALSLRAGYSYRSGESTSDASSVDVAADSAASEYNAWDPMFEDQSHGMIANRIFDGINDGVDSNGRTINLGASIEPIEDLSLSIDYYNYALDEKWNSTDAVGQARTLNGGSSATYYVKKNDDLGDELDIALNYAYTEDVTMGLACGFFFPGDAFQNHLDTTNVNDNDETATEVIASLGVAF